MGKRLKLRRWEVEELSETAVVTSQLHKFLTSHLQGFLMLRITYDLLPITCIFL